MVDVLDPNKPYLFGEERKAGILAVLNECFDGCIYENSGRATRMLNNAYDEFYEGIGADNLRMTLASMETGGLIEREIVKNRTYKIAVVKGARVPLYYTHHSHVRSLGENVAGGGGDASRDLTMPTYGENRAFVHEMLVKTPRTPGKGPGELLDHVVSLVSAGSFEELDVWLQEQHAEIVRLRQVNDGLESELQAATQEVLRLGKVAEPE